MLFIKYQHIIFNIVTNEITQMTFNKSIIIRSLSLLLIMVWCPLECQWQLAFFYDSWWAHCTKLPTVLGRISSSCKFFGCYECIAQMISFQSDSVTQQEPLQDTARATPLSFSASLQSQKIQLLLILWIVVKLECLAFSKFSAVIVSMHKASLCISLLRNKMIIHYTYMNHTSLRITKPKIQGYVLSD